MKYPFIITIILLFLFGGGYLVNKKTDNNFWKDPKSQNSTISNTESSSASNYGGEKLDLSGKGLTKAPEYIFSRTNLVELNLSNNNLNGALQAEIRHLQNLKVLNLSNNKFTGIPAEIGQLKNLEILNLSNNQLTGLPYELGNLPHLKLLDLSGNSYSEADLLIIRKSLPAVTVVRVD